MKWTITVAALGAAIALSGCMTAEQRASLDDQTCRGYGAKPGSDVYVQCRMAQDQTRAAEAMAGAQSRMAAQQAQANIANAMRLPPPPPPIYSRPPPMLY